MEGGLAKIITVMNGHLFAQIVAMLMAILSMIDIITARTVVQKWMRKNKAREEDTIISSIAS